jgi:cytidylate kinase
LPANEGSTVQSIRTRDELDSTVVEFLSPADGVELIDSTDLSFDETVEAVLNLCERRTP